MEEEKEKKWETKRRRRMRTKMKKSVCLNVVSMPVLFKKHPSLSLPVCVLRGVAVRGGGPSVGDWSPIGFDVNFSL